MDYGYFSLIASQLGVPVWLLIVILVWSSIWKLLALWKSAKKNHPVWFIVIFIVNTIGILEILYIYVFSEMKKPDNKKPAQKNRKKSKRKK